MRYSAGEVSDPGPSEDWAGAYLCPRWLRRIRAHRKECRSWWTRRIAQLAWSTLQREIHGRPRIRKREVAFVIVKYWPVWSGCHVAVASFSALYVRHIVYTQSSRLSEAHGKCFTHQKSRVLKSISIPFDPKSVIMAAERTNVSNDLIWQIVRMFFSPRNLIGGWSAGEQATRTPIWSAATPVVAPSSPGTPSTWSTSTLSRYGVEIFCATFFW